nr:type II toxin-antitoxin system PrlF family antitoxin [uncultured Azospirillum sp.]
MITSKLSRKARTTVPQPIRAALGLHEGDEIAYRIEDGCVILTRATPTSADDPFRCFTEWNSEPDQQAYDDL